MPTKLWHRASLAALLAPVLLLAACSGQTGGDSSSPPAESTADPSPSTLPSAPASTPPASQPPSIAEQFIQRISLPDAQPSVLLEDLHVSLSRTEAPEQADAMLRAMDGYLAGQLSKVQQTYEAESVQNALYAAFYSGLREMKTKIIEFQPHLGGKVYVYPEKMIWDVGGVTPLPGAKLIEQMVAQGLTFDPEVVLGEKVTSITRAEDGTLALHAASGRKHYTKTVILAIGGGILKPTKLDIEGAERYEVANLHYTVKSLAYFKDKTVLISGGGNAAVDWAKIDVGDGSSSLLAVDKVNINHGYERDKELLANSEVRIVMKNEYSIEGGPMGQTSEAGVFAAGDILHHDGKLHLIAGAFQDAANAVNQAKLYITPEANAWGMVSSHNELFKQRNRELIRGLVRAD